MKKLIRNYKKRPRQHIQVSAKVTLDKKKRLKAVSKGNSTTCQFPSAELALQVVLNEYNSTFDRSNALATRGGVLLSALLAVFILSLTSIRFDALANPAEYLKSDPLFYLFNLFVIIHIACSILSFIFLIQSTNTMTFKGVSCQDINCNEYLSHPKDKIAVSIIRSLTENINQNDAKNSIRARSYKIGAWLGASTVILFIITIILQRMLIQQV